MAQADPPWFFQSSKTEMWNWVTFTDSGFNKPRMISSFNFFTPRTLYRWWRLKSCAQQLVTLVDLLATKSHTRGSHVLTAQLSHIHFANKLIDPTAVTSQDRRHIAKARQTADIFDNPELDPSIISTELNTDSEDPAPLVNPQFFRVQTGQSPYLDVFRSHHSVRINIDSRATGNMVHSAIVKHLGCCVTRSSQSVHHEDGSSPLHVVGETCLTFTHEGHDWPIHQFYGHCMVGVKQRKNRGNGPETYLNRFESNLFVNLLKYS